MDERSAVITEMNMITPLGIGVETCWKRLIAGDSGISRITLFDPTHHRCQIAGECRDFSPEDFLDQKALTRFDRMFHLFLSVALLTMEGADLKIKDPYRFSVVGASAVGVPALFERNCSFLLKKGIRKVSPSLVINVSSNTAAGEVARRLNAKGPQHFLQEACAAGTSAIGLAMKMIQMDMIDVAIVIGADAGITPTLMASLENLNAVVGDKWNETPEKASRPFDKDRNGFVASEGAGCIIVESYEHAIKRDARILAELAGYGATCDAYHPTAGNPSAESTSRCIELALKDAGIVPEQVDYVNAHGTSTQMNDSMETKAIKLAFGKHAYHTPISSNKSMLGHMWGAAGVVETIFSVKTILEGVIPPTINLDTPDPECDLDYVPNKARREKVNIVLKNSFGFGGINGCLVIRSVTS